MQPGSITAWIRKGTQTGLRTGFPGGPVLVLALVLFLASSHCGVSHAQTGVPIPLPKVSLGIDQAEEPADVATTLQILFLLTILSLAPAILIMTTSFTRIVIVLSFLRHALGTQQTPSNQILVGLALFLTFFIMAPVYQEVHQQALGPYLAGEIQGEVRTTNVNGVDTTEEVTAFQVALERAVKPMRRFMWDQIGVKGAGEVALFMNMAGLGRPDSAEAVPTRVLIPAFIVSELKIAFQIGFVIFMPFLVIDLVTASVLMSMGMLQLPPILISMPFKILLFVLVDGWRLIVESLGRSFLGT